MMASRGKYEQLSLYIGARIAHESERAVLLWIVERLVSDRRAAVILANTNIGDRQVDLVVVMSDLCLVIEAKGVTQPIRGSENGPWQVKVASGEWKDFRSPYLQAHEAALKVKDAMRSFERKEIPYPTATVVFVPTIPGSSNAHPGDFKVSIVGLEGLDAVLRKRQRVAWPLNRWKAFAKHLGLTSIRTVDAAWDPALLAAEDLIREYQTAFRRANSVSESLVPFACRYEGRATSTEKVIRRVSDERASMLIRGPSGCGKTLLATHAGLAASEAGTVVIAIPARDYTGSIRAVMDREVRLLVRAKAVSVLGAARALNRPILFVVDGYNECQASESASLTRGIVPLTRDYEGSVLVTSRTPLVSGDQLALREVDVPPADFETKAAIARNVLDGDRLPGRLKDLLDAITTGLEAKLIGEVGRELNPSSSRYVLFDAFARKKLGDAETEGIRLLSQVAGRLCNRLAFSMSRRDLDRLSDEFGFSEAVAVRVRHAGLLIQRADRVHFAHELFFNSFAAEAVVRTASGEPTPVIHALAHPQHAGREAFILGAIDDDILLDQVLERLEAPAAVVSCLSGSCGRKAQEWAEARAENMWERVRIEASAASFRDTGENGFNYCFEKDKLTQWTGLERAFLGAMRQRILDGHYLDDVLEIIGILDQKITHEENRLRRKNGRNTRAILNSMFSTAYTFRSDSISGITNICAQLHGHIYRDISHLVKQTFERRVIEGSLSNGQLYLLLMLTRGSRIAASTIARAIETHWFEAPYHLRLDLMEAASMGHEFEYQDRKSLIETIEKLPQTRNLFLSTAIVEALANLGAFELSEREHIKEIRKQISKCLADCTDAQQCTTAYGLYAAQIDHPYSGAYSEAISELRNDERQALLMMALSGAQDTSFCVDLLLVDLVSLGGSEAGDSISRWTELPPTDSFMPQQSVAVFVIAHIALARLGCPLPPSRLVEDQTAKALVACGEILYWCNRHDLGEPLQRAGYDPRIHELVEQLANSALYVIRQCEEVLRYRMERMPGEPVVRSIACRFPDEVVEICRRSLSDPTLQVGYFQHYSELDQRWDQEFAIGVLARHGNSTDLRALRRCANDTALGTAAIAAIKAIEERLAST